MTDRFPRPSPRYRRGAKSSGASQSASQCAPSKKISNENSDLQAGEQAGLSWSFTRLSPAPFPLDSSLSSRSLSLSLSLPLFGRLAAGASRKIRERPLPEQNDVFRV